jgi:hypothetical protein
MSTPVTPDDHAADESENIDHTFGGAVLRGYVGGFVVFFVLMFVILTAFYSKLSLWGRLGASFGVAMWIGIMGGVIGVGGWAHKHGS